MAKETQHTLPRITAGLVIGLLAGSGVAFAAPELDGTWILYRAEQFGKPKLTAEGERTKETYDFRTSDPALQCIPASWTRVYSNPNTPLEITQEANQIRVRYELFDIVRTIPLVDSPGDYEHTEPSTNFAELGSSVGWYDGDTLVVHSVDYGDTTRVLSTIRQWAGLHQSPLMTTVERYWKGEEENTLQLEITHLDPVIYQEPLVVGYTLDLETEFEVMDYGCDPQDAGVNTLESGQ